MLLVHNLTTYKDCYDLIVIGSGPGGRRAAMEKVFLSSRVESALVGSLFIQGLYRVRHLEKLH